MNTREFRKRESYEAEQKTRDMLGGFLRKRGFRDIKDLRNNHGQTITATSPEGDRYRMRVRLCWRRETGSRDSDRVRTYSAAQLLAKIKDDDWEGTLRAKVARERARGVTHLLFVQREDEDILYAALVPLSELVAIWCAQRDVSDRLIKANRLGRRKKNHAMNGSSPTLWLQDDRAPEVAGALWNHSGVRDLAAHVRLPDVAACEEDADGEAGYVPQETDRRVLVERQIRERRGQQQFRDALRERFGDRCLVTGCQVLAVLEAAHIWPYRGEEDNDVTNGLLLRSDIHTLFDVDLLGIEPQRLQVELHPDVAEEYGQFAGVRLGCARDCRPSLEALKRRYERFRLGLRQTT